MNIPVKKGNSGSTFTVPVGVQEVKILPLELKDKDTNPYVLISVRVGTDFSVTKTARLQVPTEGTFEVWKGRQFLNQFCFGLCNDWIDRDLLKPKDIKESEYTYKELLELLETSISNINEVISHQSIREKIYYAIFVANQYQKDNKVIQSSRLFIPSYQDHVNKGGCFEYPYFFPFIHFKSQELLLAKNGTPILCDKFKEKYQYSDNGGTPVIESTPLVSEDIDPFL